MVNFDSAFEKISELSYDFEKDLSHYLNPNYSEAQVRLDFIDKFFIALGWDVRNDNRINPLKREVIIEKTQKQQESKAQKRADYAFYLTPDFKNPTFFVEAKKPSKNLRNADDYFQTIRYGSNAGIGISVLTDFEEFHIIDCRFKADINKVFLGQNRVFNFKDYRDKDKFAKLYWIFSKEAVQAGNIDAYVEDLPKPKKGSTQTTLFGGKWQSIDESFLEYIDGIRLTLAKAFKKNDNSLTGELLTEAATRTIDRLVFIRFLEDKLIEPENHVSEFGNRTTAWKDFINTCRVFDAKYNGVVFKQHFIDEQNFSGADDIYFRNICSELSHLNTPYAFNVIPIHILGSIYERFLGKVVIATDKRVTIDEKPEVRKAGGVYYTPKDIVDYIVKSTVGNLIQDKKPAEIAKMKFADIACGSGSFLIAVLECLFDYHIQYYNENTEEAKKDKCLYTDGIYVLSIKQKQKILLNNIYGVDLDHQAIEVTQLSLYLKMLEDETTATANEMQVLFHEKILPDLSGNIKCGNSLIGSDILSEQLFDFDEEKHLNPFDYKIEFPRVFKQGGFDAIIGNPPYVMLQNLESRFSFDYTSKKYASAKYKIDTYQLFIESGINKLRPKGVISFIVPNTYLKNIHSEPLRRFILDNTSILEILILNYPVFKGASVDTTIFIFEKTTDKKNVVNIKKSESPQEIATFNLIKQSDFEKADKLYFNLDINEADSSIISKIERQSKKLGLYCDAYFGIQTYDRSKYVTTEQINEKYKPIIDGANIERYYLKKPTEYVNFVSSAIKSGGNDLVYTQNRICIRQIGVTPIATYVEANIYTLNTIYNVFLKPKMTADLHFILGIINSSLNQFYWKKNNSDQKGTFPKIKKDGILNIPIKVIHTKKEKQLHIGIVTLVTQLLNSKSQFIGLQSSNDKDYLKRKIDASLKAIDNLVYELYQISEEEIPTIEAALN